MAAYDVHKLLMSNWSVEAGGVAGLLLRASLMYRILAGIISLLFIAELLLDLTGKEGNRFQSTHHISAVSALYELSGRQSLS